jgi:hypothetical protein
VQAAEKGEGCTRVFFQGKGVQTGGKIVLRVNEGAEDQSDYRLERFDPRRHRTWLGSNLEIEVVFREPCSLGCQVERFKMVRLLDPWARPRTKVESLARRQSVDCQSRK